jgi:methylenetetrahydrofolate dehydrogenase (NADP+)/methenyltetrahydrofolate cyclohydrolase
MPAQLLPGREIAAGLRRETSRRASAFAAAAGRPPGLGVLAIGASPESETHLRRQAASCRETGLECELRLLPAGSTQRDCERELAALSDDPAVDGVLIELPLLEGLSAAPLLERLDPSKDVEGLTPSQQGRLYGSKTIELARRAFWPCTAEALLTLLQATGVKVAGLEAVVVGRSSVVGRPTAHLLTCMDATVTLCHTKTRDVPALAKRADIVVCATRTPGWLKEVKPGAVVLDAGTHYVGGKLVGDAAPSAAEKAGFFTPVPGGVGPVTVELLLRHVVDAAEARQRR